MRYGKSGWRALLSLCGTFLVAGALAAYELGDTQSALREAKALILQIEQLQADREPAASIPLAERAVAIREKLLGPEHPDTATAIDLLGQAYRQSYYDSQAAPFILRALAIREKTLGPNHIETAASDCNLAELYLSNYRYDDARFQFQRCLAVRERVLGATHPQTAIALNGLARVYTATAKFSRAEANLQRALAIQEKTLGPEHLDTADTLDAFGALYNSFFLSSKAEPYIRRALAIREKRLGQDHPSVADSLGQLAQLYNENFSLALAESAYLRALAIREKTPGPEHRTIAHLISGLASVYLRARDFQKAEQLYRRALAAQEGAFGSDCVPVAVILSELGQLRGRTGNYNEAVSLLQRAMAIEESLGASPELIADSAYYLAIAYFHLGEDAKGESLLQHALALREQLLGPDGIRTMYTRLVLATLLWSRGDVARAVPMLQRTQLTQLKNNEEYLSLGSEARKHAYVLRLLFETSEYVSFSLAVPGAESVSLGINGVLQYKGRALDAMSDSLASARQNMKPADRHLFEELGTVVNQISMLTYGEKSRTRSDDNSKRIGELRLQQEELESALAARNRGHRVQAIPITIENIRRAVPANAALVEWYRYTPIDPKSIFSDRTAWGTNKPRYVAYVIRRSAEPAAVDLGDADEIESLVNDFRHASSDPKRSYRSSLIALSKKLLKPLAPYLGSIDQLLLSPDGALSLVPMAALTTEQGEYLAQRFEISYLTSARDLLRFNTNTRSSSSAVVIADANFGSAPDLNSQPGSPSRRRSADLDRSGLIFRPLVNTALEALDLKRLLQLSDSNVLLGDDATEANLKKLHGPRILHVASHAFFLSDHESVADKRTPLEQQAMSDDENPLLRAGIALAGANSRRSGATDDGILTALEVAQLDLHGTELVVLSACDTGIGDVQNGEGVYGLRHALVLAGAQTSVTSLWKVSDDATRKLMAEYYQRLLGGEGRAAALRHAQIAMLSDPEFSHPYFWASFVSAGNWTPISNPRAISR